MTERYTRIDPATGTPGSLARGFKQGRVSHRAAFWVTTAGLGQ